MKKFFSGWDGSKTVKWEDLTPEMREDVTQAILGYIEEPSAFTHKMSSAGRKTLKEVYERLESPERDWVLVDGIEMPEFVKERWPTLGVVHLYLEPSEVD